MTENWRKRPSPSFDEDLSDAEAIRLDSHRKRALDVGRSRLIVTAAMFAIAFIVIAGRLVDVSLLQEGSTLAQRTRGGTDERLVERMDIVDRNGIILATNLPTVSLFATPKEILDPKDAALRLSHVLPELSAAETQAKLQSGRSFIYLRRNLTPRQEYEVNALGIPGFHFEKAEKRIYPQGALTAHVVGLTDIDANGVSGIEKSFDAELKNRNQPLRLSLDIRVQAILRSELMRSKAEFRAIGAIGVVLDVRTGEIVAMSSLPDFDPNDTSRLDVDAMFNRAALGVYEMGSTFKLFNTAAALDAGTTSLTATYDVSQPIKIAQFQIKDYHPEYHPLTVAEILKESSNIGSARMALQMGTERQKDYMGRFGMLRPVMLELPEIGAPLYPATWREINTMTIAFGHGIAVTPMHVVSGVGALINGGVYHPTTLLPRDMGEAIPGERVIKPETSDKMRHLMRIVVSEGTGGKAGVPGYEVGGKTGSAEKSGGGGYRQKSLLSSFVSAFPMSDPRYVVLVMIDEPQGTKETYGFATGGWTAAPAVSRIIAQIAPILGVAPKDNDDSLSPAERRAMKAQVAAQWASRRGGGNGR